MSNVDMYVNISIYIYNNIDMLSFKKKTITEF